MDRQKQKIELYKYNNFIKPQKGKEADLQKAVVSFMQYKGHKPVHVPNEGKRSKANGADLKKQGMQTGILDLIEFELQIAIELKTGYNKPTPKQIEWIEYFRSIGWQSYWCNSLDEFLKMYNDITTQAK